MERWTAFQGTDLRDSEGKSPQEFVSHGASMVSGATLFMAGWCGPAQAANVPLHSMLESSPVNLGSLRMDGSFFVISKKAAAKPLLLGVASDGLYLNRVDTVTVGVQKEYLVPEERVVFRRAVIDVALKCFNLRPERQAAINT